MNIRNSIPAGVTERARELAQHKFAPYFFAAAGVIVASSLVWRIWFAGPSGEVETMGVYAERITSQLATPTREVYSTLDPIRQSVLAATTAGVVVGVHVQPGEAVTAGQLLVEIEPVEGSAHATIASAGVSEAELQATQLDQELRRARELHAAGAISKQQLESALAAVKGANFGVRAARARRSAAWRGLQSSAIHAPFAGTVVSRAVEVGEGVVPMRPIAVLVDDVRLSAELSLPPEEAVYVPVNAPVTTVIGSGDERRTIVGTVVRVSRAVDPRTRRIPVWVEVDNSTQRVEAAGALAEFHVPIGVPRMTLTVPQSAVFDRWSKQFVFVVEEGVARLRQIEAGDVVSSRREVRSGLRDGDIVVYNGQARLVDGTPVHFVPDPARARAPAAHPVPAPSAPAPSAGSTP